MPLTEEQKHYFDVIDTEEKAYVLGFICGDGHINIKDGRIVVSLSTDDREHLGKLAKIFNLDIKDSVGVDKRTGKPVKTSRIVLHSRDMCNSLVKKGLTNRKTEDLNETIFEHIPKNIWNHFLRGLIDADGSIFFSEKFPVFNLCSTKRMLIKVKSILIEDCGVSPIAGLEKKPGHYSYRLSGTKQLTFVRDYLYKDAAIYMDRKMTKFFSFKTREKTSRYLGVSWDSRINKWSANFYHNKKQSRLGYFDNEEDAAKAHDIVARDHNYPIYKLNFK
jgi:hypothetical protein